MTVISVKMNFMLYLHIKIHLPLIATNYVPDFYENSAYSFDNLTAGHRDSMLILHLPKWESNQQSYTTEIFYS